MDSLLRGRDLLPVSLYAAPLLGLNALSASSVAPGCRSAFPLSSCAALAGAPASAAPPVGGPPPLVTIYQAKEAEPLSEVCCG